MQTIKRNWNLYNLRLANHIFQKTKEMKEKELMLRALVYNAYTL